MPDCNFNINFIVPSLILPHHHILWITWDLSHQTCNLSSQFHSFVCLSGRTGGFEWLKIHSKIMSEKATSKKSKAQYGLLAFSWPNYTVDDFNKEHKFCLLLNQSYKNITSSSSSSFIVPSFPLLGFEVIHELPPLFPILYHIYSTMMFSFLMSSSTTLLQVFFGLPTGLLPSTSSSIAFLQ